MVFKYMYILEVNTLTETSMSGRARRAASLACAPVTPLSCGLLCCALYDVSCSVGLLHQTYAAAPTQPISFATAAQQAVAWQALELVSNLSFSISMRAPDLPSPDPRALFSLFCLGSRLPTLKSNSCLDSRPEGLGSGGATRWSWLNSKKSKQV